MNSEMAEIIGHQRYSKQSDLNNYMKNAEQCIVGCHDMNNLFTANGEKRGTTKDNVAKIQIIPIEKQTEVLLETIADQKLEIVRFKKKYSCNMCYLGISQLMAVNPATFELLAQKSKF